MKCMNCGAELTSSAYCPNCGCDVSVQKQAIVLSGLYYNQGLEKAQVRDLSGAIDQLKRSLKFNKRNIDARNLLGLVYFETGEVVSALSEWVISKNFQPDNNIASYYIDDLQKEANRLDVINQTVKKYNIALQNCQNGNEDVAIIQLKKILAQNPKLVKAYHLLSLLYIHNKEYEKARRLLKRAARIDKTNTTTLRFLKEVDEQTGTVTSLEPRFQLWGARREHAEPEPVRREPERLTSKTVRPVVHRFSMLNLIIGIIIGAAAVGFLFIPAWTQRVNREANEKVSQYSSDMADYSAQVQSLNDQVSKSKTTVDTAKSQISKAESRATASENLLKAVDAYQNNSKDTAATALGSVDSDQLSVEGKEVYTSLTSSLKDSMLSIYKKAGIEAFGNSDYKTAISRLESARSIDDSDYDVLNYLAHAYRLNKDTTNADKIFQLIIDKYPGTQKAEDAEQFLSTSKVSSEVEQKVTNELKANAQSAASSTSTSSDSSSSESSSSSSSSSGSGSSENSRSSRSSENGNDND